MTRETDVDVAYPNASASEELQARCDVANNAGVDALIDIHINAFTDPSSRGTETFHYDGSSNGSMLAQYIHCELVGIGLANRGTKTANYYVLKHTDMPAVLTEVAFISNPEEEALLSDPSFRQQVADAITRGVIRWSGN
jgi:N-acetylmuramoyl-L-alanine amidase